MMNDEFGLIVKSLAGHDCNQFYILIDSDERFVYLVDGKSRVIDNPKKKNRKHVQLTKVRTLDNISSKDIYKQLTNELIKKELKTFRKGI